MKSIFITLVLILGNIVLNAMSFLQAPPPPPPDTDGSGGTGGNNVPIDSIAIFLAITAVFYIAYYYNKSKKAIK